MLFAIITTFFMTVPIRLVGSSTNYQGRVEVYHNGEWGTVCDHGWDNADARVVCRQLGFQSSGTAYKSAYYGQGTGPIWLSNVSCIGTESKLTDCDHFGMTVRNCSHSEDAGVYCSSSYRRQLHVE